MNPQILSWLRDTGNLTVRYILVGFAFVPAGLLYAELARLGRSSVLAMGLSLALGLVTANAVWKWSATKKPSETVPLVSQAFAAALVGPAAQHWAAASTIAETRERLFLQMAASRVNIWQFFVTPVSNERVPQTDFTGRAGAVYAAFSGTSS